MKIQLRQINEQNKSDVIGLKVAADQAQYIASNEASLAEAAEYPDVARPFAVYAEEKPVGFTMFAFDEENEDPCDRYWLWRFMIDESLQGQGYGRAALAETIEYFRKHGADQITLSTKESNVRALGLYLALGFREKGEMNGEEIVLKLHLSKAQDE